MKKAVIKKAVIKKDRRNDFRKAAAVFLTAAAALAVTACGSREGFNLVEQDEAEVRVVTLYSPMEKTNPNTENVARSACDKTIAMAEEELGVSVGYITYTAADYQEKSYDDVALDRVRSEERRVGKECM